MGKVLGITRGAVWKLIKQLKAWDLDIYSITNRGYQIPNGLALLESRKILSYLPPEQKAQVSKIEIFDTLPSTNDYLLNSPHNSFSENQVCFAEKQTKGKGRRDRNWYSPFAKNIYVSIRWNFAKDPSELPGLSLVVGTALIEALRHFGIDSRLGIKWPNDVLFENQKLAGILIELSGVSNEFCSAIIGVGLNVQMPTETKILNQNWTDLQKISPKKIDRNQLAGILLNELIKTLLLFQTQGFGAFQKKWQALDLTLDAPVSIITPTAEIQGIGKGIDKHGNFLLEVTPGVIKSFSSGEVSLRLTA